MMRQLADYLHVETIGETTNAVVYRARHGATHQSVVIKELKMQNPSPVHIARFKHEYDIIRHLDIDGVVKVLDIIATGDRFALVMEDCVCTSLKQRVTGSMPVDEFLQIAVQVTETLRALHQRNIIHQDIKPSNILYNPDTNRLKLTDFGISAKTGWAYAETSDNHLPEGTLAYMSPEQTGRMNCGVDYRTDFYSLGVTFYELLTGKTPFTAPDPISLIHAHIAKKPVPPHTVNSDIPEMLSAIVMRLLAKSAEERYQSGLGLLADLQQCQDYIAINGIIPPFEIGRHDISPKFTIPQTLVGRDRELEALSQAFDRIEKGQARVLMVTGAPGIGKSALVNEMYKPTFARRGYFISGKYEQLKQAEPYSAIIKAIKGLVRQLLAENEEQLDYWRKKLRAALGINGKIITDIIGDMEMIVGKQPEMDEFSPETAQNRFKLVLKNFVHALTDKNHPLVLFLDDLQWVDPASLELIHTLTIDQDLKYFMLIGAYRDKAVPTHHPLMLTLEAMQALDVAVQTLHLEALDKGSTNAFLTKFLRCTPQASHRLASAVYGKTMGNPFFIIQFLKRLYEHNHLRLEPTIGWQWNLDAIEQMQVTENVVHFMTERLIDLPPQTLDLIKIAACIGAAFDVETLAAAAQTSIDEALASLAILVEEGLLANIKPARYRFQHDRIQEAANALLSDDDKAQLHHRIGHWMLSRTTDETLLSSVFHIADQLNAAGSVLQTPEEKHRLAEINLKAGIKAKESTAYEAAVGYLQAGINLLPENGWQTHYALTHGLYTEQMQSRFLARDFQGAEQLFDIIVTNARNNIDRTNAYNMMVVLYIETRSPEEAIALGCKALRPFKIKLKTKMGPAKVLWELVKAKHNISSIPLADILTLPLMTDREGIACQNLMSSLATPAYLVNNYLFAYMVLKSVNETFKSGLAPHAAAMFICLATIIENKLGDYQLGYDMGKMALALDQKMGQSRFSCRTHHIFAFFIQHWNCHAKHDLPFFDKVYRLGIDYGDLTYASHGILANIDTRFVIGDPLDGIYQDIKKFQTFIDQVKNPFISSQYELQRQWVRNLKGLASGSVEFSNSDFDEEAFLEKLRADNNAHGLCFSLLPKIKLLYLFGCYDKAYTAAKELDRHIMAAMGTLIVSEHHYYYALILIALLREKKFANKFKFKKIISRSLRKLAKWAVVCPENFQHKHDLVKAEWAALGRQFHLAAGHYRLAIKNARKNDYVNDEALACERLAEVYRSMDAREEALIFFKRAHQCYGYWGARAKQRDLEQRHPNLFSQKTKGLHVDTISRSSITGAANRMTRQMDLAMVTEASQSISSEIVLDNLLEDIMYISITNAGAQRGYLILEKEGELTIVAGKETDGDILKETFPVPVKESREISHAIVYFVNRTLKPVILANALNEGLFTQDPHVQRRLCKSILCMPIMNKEQRSGILYLENNLTTNAFTKERLEVLGTIATQAAISLENARLFELATTDGLTNLFSYRYFQHLLDLEIDRSLRYQRTFSLLLMDIDDFEQFNDTYGRPKADEALKRFAQLLKTNIRGVDIAARYSGEAFILLLPETGLQQAMIVCEKIRTLAQHMPIPNEKENLSITVSIGVVTFLQHALDKNGLLNSVDSALKDAKKDGRNRISVGKQIETERPENIPFCN